MASKKPSKPKGLVVRLGAEVSQFGLARLTRDKVYGKKRRVVVDEQGEPCLQTLLINPGSTMLAPGGTATVYQDKHHNAFERKGLTRVSQDGTPIEAVASTLGQVVALEGPVDPRELLDHTVTAVYALEADALGGKLAAALGRGEVYQARFAYRSGYSDNPLFILEGQDGFYGLLGEASGFEYCEPEPSFEDFDELDLLESLDFSDL